MNPRRTIGLTFVCAALLCLCGCGHSGRVRVQNSPPRPVADVDAVGLRLTPPSPVNWDDRPGADGLQVQVNFFRLDEDLSVTVKGARELTLFEGNLKANQLAGARVLQTWRFNAADLSTFCGKSAFGWGYAMRLPWGASPPSGSNATLIAKYISPTGRTIAAEPIVVPLGPG